MSSHNNSHTELRTCLQSHIATVLFAAGAWARSFPSAQ